MRPPPDATCRGLCRRTPYAADREPKPEERSYWAKGYSYCQQCRAYMQGETYRCPCDAHHHVRGRQKRREQQARSARMSSAGRVGGQKREGARHRHGKKKHRKTEWHPSH